MQEALLVKTILKYYLSGSKRTWILQSLYSFLLLYFTNSPSLRPLRGPRRRQLWTEVAPPAVFRRVQTLRPHSPSDAPRGFLGHTRRHQSPSYPKSHMGRSGAMVLWKTKNRTKARGGRREGTRKGEGQIGGAMK